jgi:hypothetical protein
LSDSAEIYETVLFRIEGETLNAQDAGNNFIEDHVKKSKTFKRPVIIEEFGIASDQRSMDPKSSTADRDLY